MTISGFFGSVGMSGFVAPHEHPPAFWPVKADSLLPPGERSAERRMRAPGSGDFCPKEPCENQNIMLCDSD
jgi:hypothetical protein